MREERVVHLGSTRLELSASTNGGERQRLVNAADVAARPVFAEIAVAFVVEGGCDEAAEQRALWRESSCCGCRHADEKGRGEAARLEQEWKLLKDVEGAHISARGLRRGQQRQQLVRMTRGCAGTRSVSQQQFTNAILLKHSIAINSSLPKPRAHFSNFLIFQFLNLSRKQVNFVKLKFGSVVLRARPGGCQCCVGWRQQQRIVMGLWS